MFTFRARRRPLIYLIIGALLLILLLKWFTSDNLDWDLMGPMGDDPAHVRRDPELRIDRWIITTTILHPTVSMKRLAQIPGWKLLVVGDRKTPTGWNIPGAIYLDIKSQKDLRYQVHSYLSYDSYSRKIIGYLYAIEHGAKYIYETDDDNYPNERDLDHQFITTVGQTEMLGVQTKQITFNPMVHFGQGTLWPRGYPLDRVGLPSDRIYQLCNTHAPAIQQGLVEGDPDVDAIFRLTRKHGEVDLDLTFDKVAPAIVLPKGTFVPLNSQNTLYTARAFWSLVLPVSVSMRECDIYRSYWAQALLWLVGENAAYSGPNAVQKRNPHSYIMDAYDESRLYHQTGAFINYLKKWTCDKVFFFDCVSQLTHDLVIRGFLEGRDANLVDAWITDLSTVGYVPPVMQSVPTCKEIKDAPRLTFYPDEQPTVLPHSPLKILPEDLVNHRMVKKYLTETCGYAHANFWHAVMHKGHKFSDELLIISLYGPPEELIPALEATYRPHFPHILYCGPELLNGAFLELWRVSYVTPPTRVSGVACVIAALRLGFRAEAFIHITDSMYLNMHGQKLLSNQKHLTWVTGELDAYRPEMVAHCKEKTIHCVPMTKETISKTNRFADELQWDQSAKSKMRECFSKLASDPSFMGQTTLTWVTDMTFRLPVSALERFHALGEHFLKDASHRESDYFAVLLMECLEHTVEYMSYGSLKDLTEEKQDYIFPYAFRSVEADEGPLNQHFCGHFEKYSPDGPNEANEG